MPRKRTPAVTKAALGRVVELLRALGVTMQAVDVMPGKVRIYTSQGLPPITLSDSDDDELEKELADYRKAHGYG